MCGCLNSYLTETVKVRAFDDARIAVARNLARQTIVIRKNLLAQLISRVFVQRAMKREGTQRKAEVNPQFSARIR